MKSKLTNVFLILFFISALCIPIFLNSLNAYANESIDDWIGETVDIMLWNKSSNLSTEMNGLKLLAVTDLDSMNGGIIVQNRKGDKLFIYHMSIQAIVFED